MAMILEDAMDCYVRFTDAKTESGKREYRDAVRWLFGKSHDWIFSFESICAHLGVAPEFVRCRLRSSKTAQRGNRAQPTAFRY